MNPWEGPDSVLQSPNCSSRRGEKISAVVFRNSGSMSLKLDRYLCKETKRSTHFVIFRNPEEGVVQLVDVRLKAWHAGRAKIWGEPHVNMYSVGIQLVGTNESGYTQYQYERAASLVAYLMEMGTEIEFNRIFGQDAISEGGGGLGSQWKWDVFFDLTIQQLYGLKIPRA